MRHHLLTIIIAAALSVASLARTEDWPEFRGPTGQGHSTALNLPTEWSNTNNVAWKQPIPGQSWSSPIVHRGHIYLTAAVPVDGSFGYSLRALCLDAATGKLLWNEEAFGPPSAKAPQIHSKNSHASPTPIVEGDRLYVHFGHLGTACLDLNGKVLWRNTSLNYEPVHGNGGSPILVDDALIFSCEGAKDPFVVALDKNDGSVLWKVDRISDAAKKFSFSTPLLIMVNGHKQVISPGSNVVCAYDPKTGKEIWHVRYDGYSVVPRPVFGHGMIYISTAFDRPITMAIRPDGEGDVTATHVTWTTNRGAPNTPSLLLVDDELYMVSDAGMASCLDAKTGKLYWQERIGGNCSASPVYADGKIYIQNEQGVGVVLKAGKEYQKLASNALNERTLASYAIGDRALFIRTDQNLYRIESR
ncbi:MAG: serine/threonine protein kinase [Pedosphaera sp.]|nr:serine/threonine protein kinase [Pedosphaera sp.]